MPVLTWQNILNANDRPAPEKIEVPEWGGDVLMQSPSSARREAVELSVWSGERDEDDEPVRDLEHYYERWICLCLVDESGNDLCPDPVAAAEQLSAKIAPVIQRLWPVAQRLCGLSKQQQGDLGKNS